MLLIILFLFLAAKRASSDQPSLAVGRFLNPGNAPETTLPFSENLLWTTGQVQTIKFTTTYSNYTIALWQQNLQGGFALLGPVIFQTQTGAFPQFDWVVQTFDLDTSFSNVFFLWLHAGASTDQGTPQPLSVTSEFFNITSDSSSSASSTIPAGSIMTASSSSTPASEPTISVTVTQQISDPVATTPSSVLPSDTHPATIPLSQGQALTTGAQIGIGVGVGVVGISILSLISYWLWKRKRTEDGTNSTLTYDIHGLDDNSQIVWKPSTTMGPAELDARLYDHDGKLSHTHVAELG